MLWVSVIYAQAQSQSSETGGSMEIIENKGHLPEQVLYKARLTGGSVYFEKEGIRFDFISPADWGKFQAHHHNPNIQPSEFNSVKAHNYFVRFVNGDPEPFSEGKWEKEGLHHYIQGNDPEKWSKDNRGFGGMIYHDIYPGIDFKYYGSQGRIKYDIILDVGSDPDEIIFEYMHIEELSVSSNRLIIQTSVNTIEESIPLAYQDIKGRRRVVKCEYVLNDNLVSFNFPEGYNPEYPVIIDPILTFSSYSGSTADNFGFTATNDDDDGFLFAGGIVFDNGYPTTNGAYNTSFSGSIDLGITKFSKDGTSLIYSTYIGGSDAETPHSLIVNDNGDLYIFGVTGSLNYPVLAGAYQDTFRGGQFASFPSNGATFTNGTDLYITCLDNTGANLLGSTYIGGTVNDGLNDGPANPNGPELNYNYGDQFRGEIILDPSGNVYVASCTRSQDFPVTNIAFQPIFGGIKDGVVFKMNALLTQLVWSSFIGGADEDAAYSLKLDGLGDVYVGGGTGSIDFRTTPNALHQSPRGEEDGFLIKVEESSVALVASTYLGTNRYDQVYFVEVDDRNKPWVVGQTAGDYPVTSGVYKNDSSGQFITKLEDDLSSILISTVFGKGDKDPELSPTAFLVDRCNNIYVSGWGGSTNGFAVNPDTDIRGMPLTSDAFQDTSEGSDFYFFVLSGDAASLIYATYFGGSTSSEHVDGGTSRFDKDGIIYQAVCAGCGGNSDFPTTPNAWSNNNNSSNCNIGVLKFEFQLQEVKAAAAIVNDKEGCIPFTVEFQNEGTQNVSYLWIFGDGNTSTDENPVYTFDSAGIYIVKLIVFDPNSACLLPDTANIEIIAHPFALADFTYLPEIVNFGEPVDFTNLSIGGSNYVWVFGDGETSIEKDPRHIFAEPGVYNVCLWVYGNGNCNDSICKRITIPIVDVPNAFSPNGDGKNDVFYVKGFGIADLKFRIYNRWGILMFETNNIDIGWDGTHKGQPQEQDVYVFHLEAIFETNEFFRKKGNLTLIR